MTEHYDEPLDPNVPGMKMSKPIVKHIHNGYRFMWCQGIEEVLTVEISRIKDSRHEIYGELTVEHMEMGELLSGIKVNLTSLQIRGQIVKRLQGRPDLNMYMTLWAEIIEYVFRESLNMSRQGEPVQELFTNAEVQPPTYLLHPFLIENYPTIIFGERSASKSTLAIILATCLLLPWHDNPLGITVPDKSIKTLYLDWESDAPTINWQVRRLQHGMGLPPFGISYRRCHMPLWDDVDAIKDHMDNIGAEVLIVDSLGFASGGELKEPVTALNFHKAIRTLNTTSLILAHTAKDNGEYKSRQKTVFGSMFFEAQARSIWELKKVQTAEDEEISVSLFHTKPPPFGKQHRPIGYKYIYEPDKIQVELQDPKTVVEFLERMNTQTRITEFLKSRGGHALKDDIVDYLGLRENTASVALHRLAKKNVVLKVLDEYKLLQQ